MPSHGCFNAKTLSFHLALAFVAFGGFHREAWAGQINFDDATDGTVVNTRYPGVTFSDPTGLRVEIWGKAALDCP